ncbi:MAG: HEAT repeat domain-containing protein [Anaerolineales bacterium]|nr:MAG: HEAT repeat domain-containing protein [Anaerolineales bacterium]
MNTQPNPFQPVLDSLLDEKKEFPRKHLQQFSDLGELELKILLDVWSRVGLKRKLTLLEGLESLAEDDTLVNFDDLGKALLTDADSVVRGRAIRLLRECEDAKLIPIYIAILKNDAEVHTRAEAATALGAFVDLGELEELAEEALHQVEEALLESVNGGDDVKVRRRALESLGFSSRPEIASLIESAFGREDPAWQASALFAMARSADSRWDEPVIRSLMNDNRNVREAAVEAAGQLSVKTASPILLKMLEDEEDDDVAGAIIWSLSQIGGEDARTYIENLLDQTEDEDQIEFLEEALENLAFTEDLDRFDLLNFEPDFDLDEDDEDKALLN